MGSNMYLTNEQQKFAQENHNLIYSFLVKFNFNVDEWYGMAAIGFCRAIILFNPELGYAFSTFAYKAMYNTIIRAKKYETKYREKVTLSYRQININSDYEQKDLFLEDIYGYEQDFETEISEMNLLNFKKSLSDKHQTIFLGMINGKSQKEIAKETNYSQTQISRISKKIKDKLIMSCGI